MNKLKMFKKALVLSSLIIIFMSKGLYAESEEQTDKDEKQVEAYSRFLNFSSGFNLTVYRDFGTSPLSYCGSGINFSNSWLYTNSRDEHFIGFSSDIGMLTVNPPESQFMQVSGQSVFTKLNLRYKYLYKIDRISDEKYDIRLGGSADITQLIRANESLMNAGGGFETFINFSAACKVTRDISRYEQKVVDFYFFKRFLQPVKRHLTFELAAGVINFNRQPGYAYVYDAEIDGSATNPLTWINSDYQWSLNGWRVGTELAYYRFRETGNGRKVSYHWDIVHAPGKYDAFQFAMHRLKYTIIINNNK